MHRTVVSLTIVLGALQLNAQSPRVTPAGDPSVKSDTIYSLAVKPADYADQPYVYLLDDGMSAARLSQLRSAVAFALLLAAPAVAALQLSQGPQLRFDVADALAGAGFVLALMSMVVEPRRSPSARPAT